MRRNDNLVPVLLPHSRPVPRGIYHRTKLLHHHICRPCSACGTPPSSELTPRHQLLTGGVLALGRRMQPSTSSSDSCSPRSCCCSPATVWLVADLHSSGRTTAAAGRPRRPADHRLSTQPLLAPGTLRGARERAQRDHLKLQRRRARPRDTFVECVRCLSRSCWCVVLLAAAFWFTGYDSPIAIMATCTVVCCV